MDLNIDREAALLQRQKTKQLRERYRDLFGEPTKTGNRTWLLRRIVWRLQALAQGDLSDRARQRADTLANDADLRVVPPKDAPAPDPARTATVRQPVPTPAMPLDPRLPTLGTILTRVYKGETIHVQVRTDGFEWRGELFPSLSAVAKAITGSHCNGFAFFKLTGDPR